MFDLTKEFLATLKEAIIPEKQLVPLGPTYQFVCATCTGTCRGSCKGGCKGSCGSGCSGSCRGRSG